MGEVPSLASAIIKALFEIEFDRSKIMEEAKARYNPKKVAKEYIGIYNALNAEK
jgi:hypothetical protein